jgi:phage terminase large subunit-like protein
VRDGRVTGGVMLPLLYEFPAAVQADREKPWRDPTLWPAVLPNLGRSVNLDAMKQGLAEAEAKGADELQRWASQHLNVEIGVALTADRWAGADIWSRAVEDGLTLEALIARAEVATIGIDGGGMDDLLGLAVIGRDRVTKAWLLWAHAWAHPVALERRKEIAPTLRALAEAGDVTICADATQDLREAADVARRLAAAGLLPEAGAVGLDPVGVAALVDELAAAGLTEDQMRAVGQGWRLNAAILGMERKLHDGTFRHGGQNLMDWTVGNARVEPKGNALMVTKAAAGRAKIDALCAAFNAFELMSRNPQPAGGPSYLASDGLVVL